jgi:arsenate reductase
MARQGAGCVKATIYHNPRCSKSREALAILNATPGLDVEIVEYLKTPPSSEKLADLYKRAGISPRDGLRKAEEGAKALKDASDDALVKAMAADPILIERPLVETEKGVRLGRPPEKIREIL